MLRMHRPLLTKVISRIKVSEINLFWTEQHSAGKGFQNELQTKLSAVPLHTLLPSLPVGRNEQQYVLTVAELQTTYNKLMNHSLLQFINTQMQLMYIRLTRLHSKHTLRLVENSKVQTTSTSHNRSCIHICMCIHSSPGRINRFSFEI